MCNGRLGLACAAILLLAPGHASAQAEQLLDRVLASVEGRVITLSDVRTAVRFGLVNTAGSGDPAAAAPEHLIDRVIILTEVDRYAPPEPDPAAVAGAVAAMRARFDSRESFERALRLAGLQEQALAEWARNDMRIEQYLQARFAGAAEPTDEDVEAYVRQHEAELRREGRAPTDEAVQRRAREAVAGQRRAAVVAEWVRGLRARVGVAVAPPQ